MILGAGAARQTGQGKPRASGDDPPYTSATNFFKA